MTSQIDSLVFGPSIFVLLSFAIVSHRIEIQGASTATLTAAPRRLDGRKMLRMRKLRLDAKRLRA